MNVYILMTTDPENLINVYGVYDSKTSAKRAFKRVLSSKISSDFQTDAAGRNFNKCIQDLEYFANGNRLFVSERPVQTVNDKDYLEQLYSAYQLYWMLSHGYSIDNLIDSLNQVELFDINVTNIYNNWEHTGFNGKLWDNFDEFITHDFLVKHQVDILINLMPQEEREEIREWYTSFREGNQNLAWH